MPTAATTVMAVVTEVTPPGTGAAIAAHTTGAIEVAIVTGEMVGHSSPVQLSVHFLDGAADMAIPAPSVNGTRAITALTTPLNGTATTGTHVPITAIQMVMMVADKATKATAALGAIQSSNLEIGMGVQPKLAGPCVTIAMVEALSSAAAAISFTTVEFPT